MWVDWVVDRPTLHYEFIFSVTETSDNFDRLPKAKTLPQTEIKALSIWQNL